MPKIGRQRRRKIDICWPCIKKDLENRNVLMKRIKR